MLDKNLDNKILKLIDRITLLIKNNDNSVESVHKIRTKTREILSLLYASDLKSKEIKKVIKLSNKIRDIDVLLSEFLPNIPQYIQKNLEIQIISMSLKNIRDEEFLEFQEYLKQFLEKNISFLETQTKKNLNQHSKDVYILSYEKKELHRYRIFIKKELYLEKNRTNRNLDKIELLTQIKDLMGNINDNRNAIEMIEHTIKKQVTYFKLKQYIEQKNIDLFHKIKKLVNKLESL